MNTEVGKVSVVIPTYNRGDVILDAVTSVLSQTYENLELCIVDDGSSDSTLKILEGVSDSRVHVKRHEVNRGACAALNTGIAATNGEFIAFLDTDDCWHPTKLMKQVQRMREDSSKIVVAVGCGWELMDGRPGRIPQEAAATFHDILKGVPGSGGPTLLVRRLPDQPQWTLELPSMQDRVFLIDYARHGEVVFISESLVRVGRGRRDHITNPRATMLAYEGILRLLDEDLLKWPDVRSYYHVRAAREALILRDRGRALAHLKLARSSSGIGWGVKLEFLLGYALGYPGLAVYTRLRGRHGYS